MSGDLHLEPIASTARGGGIRMLLTLLFGSVLAGFAAFFFSTVVITLLGEAAPQAYLSSDIFDPIR
jgi:hypothetical protein